MKKKPVLNNKKHQPKVKTPDITSLKKKQRKIKKKRNYKKKKKKKLKK